MVGFLGWTEKGGKRRKYLFGTFLVLALIFPLVHLYKEESSQTKITGITTFDDLSVANHLGTERLILDYVCMKNDLPSFVNASIGSGDTSDLLHYGCTLSSELDTPLPVIIATLCDNNFNIESGSTICTPLFMSGAIRFHLIR